MFLKDVLQGLDYALLDGDIYKDIGGISYDSRKVMPGDFFVCIPGFKTDGHQFVEQAINNGASAILAEKQVEVKPDVTLIQVADCREAMPLLAANFYGYPSQDMRVIGVTGTNGKTTTSHLIKAILEEGKQRPAILGTLYAKFEREEFNLGHTTPEALEIERFFNLARGKGANYVVMEVSSHALDLKRVDQIEFAVAVFTNLTQDHLDYHHSMEAYKDAKLKLFRRVAEAEGKFAIINADDPSAKDFLQACNYHAYTYGIEKEADIRATEVRSNLKGSQFVVNYPGGSFNIDMRLIGRFSVYNTLAATAYALREGVAPPVIKSALEKVTGVPGRFEQVDAGQDFTVVVDYAHTPDGLENILKTARDIVEGRLITVFGCGGDRDRGKRPLMGKIAAQYSDFCIVTSDNPRSEDPEAIIDEILPGVRKVKESRFAKIVDRREAIHQAIYLAQKGDLVIIAGKGHETYQLVKDKVLDFDDREVAREFLKGKTAL